MRKTIAGVWVITALLVSNAYAFGPVGHETIGAVADQRLANKPAAAKITKLLDGLSLAEASLLADRIKEWDNLPADNLHSFHLPQHPQIEAQLRAFWQANPPSPNEVKNKPSHHWFHYTDVPVLGDEKYSDGKTGRSQWDIVHMMPFCIRVLRGVESDQNARKITKPVALILLAHYVGDIHQPLHVGAEYFNSDGKPVNPDKSKTGFPDEGGNSLVLILREISDHGPSDGNVKLHGYWDHETVTTALQMIRQEIVNEQPGHPGKAIDEELIRRLATREPQSWKLAAQIDPKNWPEAWANEVLVVAKEAHRRLEFAKITLEVRHGKTIAAGFAKEKLMPDRVSYRDWSGKVVKAEIHKAGWRLAALLEQIIR
jgi:hypothetical protein